MLAIAAVQDVEGWVADAAPEYLVVGHVTFDRTPGGYRPGGTAVYAALTARRLGQRVALVTSAAPHYDFATIVPGVTVANHAALSSTIFENVPAAGGRAQRLLARAAEIELADVPPAWRGANIVHLAPIADEVPRSLMPLFPRALVGLTAQGCLRQWDADGRVRARPWVESETMLRRADVTILSDEDLAGDAGLIADYATRARLFVLTRGPRGASVYFRGEVRDVPAFPVKAVDTTGAGDVFAAAYLVALWRGVDPFRAARFANCAASFAIERPGTEGIPDEAMIEERLARG